MGKQIDDKQQRMDDKAGRRTAGGQRAEGRGNENEELGVARSQHSGGGRGGADLLALLV